MGTKSRTRQLIPEVSNINLRF